MGFLRRLKLGYRYATWIDVMIGSITRSDLAVVVDEKPELLTDEALGAVDMMFDNAEQAGDAVRADQLALIRKFLLDARVHGVARALANIPKHGPLGFQDPPDGGGMG